MTAGARVTVNLGADVGEGMPTDAELIPLCTSVAIACGQHAGDPATMQHAVALARRHGVAIGAHPGYPDREGFGRRAMKLDANELFAWVVYQVGALAAVARVQGANLTHVKAHGALYNHAAGDAATALTLAAATRAVDGDLWLVGLAGSAMATAAATHGLRFVAEGFVDRAYREDGRLVPRAQPGAVISGNAAEIAARAVRMIRDGVVEPVGGGSLSLRIDSLCVHGDHPEAVGLARALRAALAAHGIDVVPFDRVR
jgi:UPF0271 protein